jgi:hypothetical protein
MTLAPTRPASGRLTREQATILARYAGGDSATNVDRKRVADANRRWNAARTVTR